MIDRKHLWDRVWWGVWVRRLMTGQVYFAYHAREAQDGSIQIWSDNTMSTSRGWSKGYWEVLHTYSGPVARFES